MQIKTYIDDFFRYLDSFEVRFAEFQTEAFLQTYNGIYAVFQALREQREKAVEVDEYFYEKIRQIPLTGSDLRQLSIQIMITYFESEADTDGQSNKSYLYCRGLRGIKQDIPFFENNLLPLLFKENALNGNYRLLLFFLDEIGRYINKFGKKIQPNLNPEEFLAFADGMKLLELSRRRLELGKDLLRERNSLEFHLQRIALFKKMSQKDKTFDYILSTWQYFSKTSFWTGVKNSLSVFFGKIGGAFSSSRYFRLAITQRTPAYFYYFLIIVLFIFLAIYVPISWNKYTQNKLTQFQERADRAQNGATK
jgi:hypothetical protein